jgi:hypothetical protein
MEELKEKIKEIITYYSNDGTNGYSLNDKQIDRIIDLFKEYLGDIEVEHQKELEEFMNVNLIPYSIEELEKEIIKRKKLK